MAIPAFLIWIILFFKEVRLDPHKAFEKISVKIEFYLYGNDNKNLTGGEYVPCQTIQELVIDQLIILCPAIEFSQLCSDYFGFMLCTFCSHCVEVRCSDLVL